MFGAFRLAAPTSTVTLPAAVASSAADTALSHVPCAAFHRTNAASSSSLPVILITRNAPQFQSISIRSNLSFVFCFCFQSSFGCFRVNSCSLRLSCCPIKAMSQTDTVSVPHGGSQFSASGIL